ncbi:response regulator [Ruminococcaceae bacterium OttesenSCG-928-D13]|nr:response regulator [Ruminococcaceae bacterium OttesenSCG-928-D13]
MNHTLLVVEDEEIIRRGLLYSLDWHALGFGRLLQAADGCQAVRLITEEKPDVVIMDINIPFIGGLEVLEQTQPQTGYSAIVLTGYAEFDYARRALAVGAARYLLKPVDFAELEEAVRSAIEQTHHRAAYNRVRQATENLRETDLLAAWQAPAQPSELTRRMLDYVGAHYGGKLSLAEMSARLHYSETFLARKFKEEMGLNFSDYLARYRIQQSLALLRAGGHRIEDVAGASGFADARYFAQVFKKHIGCSPREYLRLMQTDGQ